LIKSVAFLPDVHLTGEGRLTKAWKVAKLFVNDYKPSVVILGGDFMEMESLSGWLENQKRQLEDRRYAKELTVANRELDELQNSNPGAKYWFMEGNHEGWVERYLDKNPSMEGHVGLQKDLRLAERKMEFVKENGLLQIGKLYFLHGWYHNMYHAKRHLQELGDNCMYGHVHKPQLFTQELRARRRTHGAWSVGCLCDLNPRWLRNKPNSWQHGFGLVEFRPDGMFQPHLINIIDGKMTFAGETWRAK
jgi:predicted phosphodiesterase